MKIRLFVLISQILLLLFSLQAYPLASGSSQPISGYDELSGTIIVGGGSLTQQAQAERAAMMGQHGKDILGETVGSTLSSESGTTQKAIDQEPNQTAETLTTAANITNPHQSEISPQPATISGSWSFDLNDSTLHKAVLTIFQNGDTIFGTGNIDLDSRTIMMATASGTVTGDKVNLDLLSLGKISLYRIFLIVTEDSASGNYTSLSPGGASKAGTVNGVRAVALS